MSLEESTPVGDKLLQRLRHFRPDYFPLHQQRFQDLVEQGQHPKALFIGCSDSRLVPCLLTGAGPGSCSLCAMWAPGAALRSFTGLARQHGCHRICRCSLAPRCMCSTLDVRIVCLRLRRVTAAPGLTLHPQPVSKSYTITKETHT